PFIHVHVENVRAALHLLARHGQRTIEIVAENQFRELWRTGDVRSLTDDNEAHLRSDIERLETGKLERRALSRPGFIGRHGDRPSRWNTPRPVAPHRVCDCANVRRSRSATTTHDIEPAILRP